jgi:hypothetical protein
VARSLKPRAQCVSDPPVALKPQGSLLQATNDYIPTHIYESETFSLRYHIKNHCLLHGLVETVLIRSKFFRC